jgi:copper chaperone
METATLDIKGMTCMGCVNSVTKVLKATPGVQNAQVTLSPGAARVDYDAAVTTIDQLKSAVEDAGYEAA